MKRFAFLLSIVFLISASSCSLFDNDSRSFSMEDWELLVADGEFDTPVRDYQPNSEWPLFYTLVRSGEYLNYEFKMDATWSVKKITLTIALNGRPISEKKEYTFARRSEVVVRDSIFIPADLEYLTDELPPGMQHAILRTFSLYDVNTRRGTSHSLWIVE